MHLLCSDNFEIFILNIAIIFIAAQSVIFLDLDCRTILAIITLGNTTNSPTRLMVVAFSFNNVTVIRTRTHDENLDQPSTIFVNDK